MKQPTRVIAGTARPYEPFWQVRDAATSGSGEAEVELYGMISEYSWMEDEITPKKFKEDLHKAGGGGPVTVRINSGGGDVIAASVIKATLLDYPGRVTAQVDGLAASAATIVLMGADRVRAVDSAYLMIHDPIAMAAGNIEQLKQVVDLLQTIKAGIIDGYQAKTKLTPEKLAKMMSAETWMTAQEAQSLGFVDEVVGAGGKKNGLKNVAVLNALMDYGNLPAELWALLAQETEPVIQPANDGGIIDQAADRLRAEVKILMKEL